MDNTNFENLEPTLIALLFASGEAITLDSLAEILELDKDILKVEIDSIIKKYENSDRGIIIKQINNSYQLASSPKHYEYTKKLFQPRQRQALTQSALEVLAIIAYNQGITRAEIEKIRGVNSDSGVTALLERELIKDAGRLDAPGRPIIYETTDNFLKYFGYKTLDDLPKINFENEVSSNDNKGSIN